MGDPVEEAFVTHLRARGLRPNTVAHAERVLRWYREVIGTAALDASPFDLERFLIRRTNLATRAVEWSYLSMFYRWAVRFDLLDKNPLDKVDRPRVPKRRPRPMPADDLARILTESPKRLRPWFHLAAGCGLRACEIAPMRAEDLRLRPHWLYVPETKGGGERWVPVPAVVVDALDGLPTTGYMFPPVQPRTPLPHVTAHLVSELTNRWLRSIGARQSFHGLRHWYGTHFLRAAGGNLRVAQEALGHARSSTTELYTQVGDDEIMAAAARLSIPA